MYFLSMKIHDRNNEIPLMSEHSDDIVNLVEMADNMFELLTRCQMPDITVVGNDFETYKMSGSIIKMIDNELNDFEWKFLDKYDRTIKCYITRNV